MLSVMIYKKTLVMLEITVVGWLSSQNINLITTGGGGGGGVFSTTCKAFS